MHNILVTGNMGYIGSVLVPTLQKKGYTVRGLDAGYYGSCSLYKDQCAPSKQIIKDIRKVEAKDVEGIDGIVHLAALSNDPLGEFSPGLTDEINRDATIHLAELARKAGVKRFVYASSQSMYGVSNTDAELDEDRSDKNPVTAYARTKWEAEIALKKLATDRFLVTCFRPSTVFGLSPQLRCDIVFNYFVACAYTTGHIEIKSDGSPWRPVVHIKDVSSAFIAGLEAPESLVASRSFNVGVPDGNYTVRQLAEAAQACVPNSTLKFTGEHGADSRTYRVSFKRILSELAEFYCPQWTLIAGGQEMVEKFKAIGFSESDFRGAKCVRLMRLKDLRSNGQIDDKFYIR